MGRELGALICRVPSDYEPSPAYAAQVMLTPQAELERVLQKYPPMRWQELCIYLLSIAAMLVASHYRDVDWYFFVGMLTGIAAWEFTKFRMRRNARDFACAHP